MSLLTTLSIELKRKPSPGNRFLHLHLSGELRLFPFDAAFAQQVHPSKSKQAGTNTYH